MQAKTIDEVIAFLDEIIDECKKSQSPAGYFAALYREVTITVKKRIADGYFQDGPRMEILDVNFANRYLQAYTEYKSNQHPSTSWEVAFVQTKNYWPIVLQHLLLGMNAHISLDLGVAAAVTCPGKNINGLKEDFDRINTILSNLVGDVEKKLSEIWPKLKWILKFTGKADDFLIDFSMEMARDGAWKFATQLAALNTNDQAAAIATRDQKVAVIAKLVSNPGIIASAVFKMIRLGEKGTVTEKIERMVGNNSCRSHLKINIPKQIRAKAH